MFSWSILDRRELYYQILPIVKRGLQGKFGFAMSSKTRQLKVFGWPEATEVEGLLSDPRGSLEDTPTNIPR